MQNNVIPGAVGLIASPDRGDWTGTFGTGTLGAEDPMSVDDHFRNAGLLFPVRVRTGTHQGRTGLDAGAACRENPPVLPSMIYGRSTPDDPTRSIREYADRGKWAGRVRTVLTPSRRLAARCARPAGAAPTRSGTVGSTMQPCRRASGRRMRFAVGPAGPKRPGQFAAQLPASLHIQGLINGLVHQVPFPLAAELDQQRVADLLRASAQKVPDDSKDDRAVPPAAVTAVPVRMFGRRSCSTRVSRSR